MQQSPQYANDTIVAAATPAGSGGVAVVRCSGPDSAAIGKAMLGKLPPPRVASLRRFHDAHGEAVDQGLALWFPAPDSYTGEAVLELHGHGGPVLVQQLVEAAVTLGARRAEPGEFSRRAFLNDKLDLAQAEAIADLIGSGTRQAARAALRSLSGEFSQAVAALTEQLVRLRLHVEAAIDFPEEEIDFLSDHALARRIEDCGDAFQDLLRRAGTGRVLRDGLQVVIIGPPNAGKSSLMNRLSGEDTAIVTEVAGTTRDILRERIDLDGLLVELIDTAGLREDPDRIEAEGIRRATRALTNADAIVWVQDDSQPHCAPPPEVTAAAVPVIAVRNKIDLSGHQAGGSDGPPVTVYLSATRGAGIDELRARLRALAGNLDSGEGAFSARGRHVEALQAAERHFEQGKAALQTTRAGELLAEELRLAQLALDEISGRFTSDDLLGRIFSEFCIGK